MKTTLVHSLVFVLFLIGLACQTTTQVERYDLLIKNTWIVDGTGNAGFGGSVAIRGEKIVAVGDVRGEAEVELDGSGLITCPGFIDPHSHADTTIMEYPLAPNLVMQGITTFLGGNCGMSPAPQSDTTFAKWLSDAEKEGIAVNYAPLVGHRSVRTAVMGDDFKREATDEEICRMKSHVDEAMSAGALGLSSFADPKIGRAHV